MADGNGLLVFGMGFSGRAIADRVAAEFPIVYGTARTPEKLEAIRELGHKPVGFDGERFSDDLREKLGSATHLLISIAPDDRDPVLQLLPDALNDACPALKWIGYLSTVGVYGNHDGAWVNEDTEPRPVSQRSIQRLRAERSWIDACKTADLPLSIFRLSGIYGPGRNAFINMEKGRARRLVKQGQVFNRIHVDDIASAVERAIDKCADGVFNITDDLPAPPQDVVTFAHELAGREPPPPVDFETAELTPMARSFYGENKRVSNERSKQVLGMNYRYPDYRTALQRMWDEGSWKA